MAAQNLEFEFNGIKTIGPPLHVSHSPEGSSSVMVFLAGKFNQSAVMKVAKLYKHDSQFHIDWNRHDNEKHILHDLQMKDDQDGKENVVRIANSSGEELSSDGKFLTIFMVMEGLHSDLANAVFDDGRNHLLLDPYFIHIVLQGAAKGLHFLHGQGIVHRDIKQENIFISDPLLPGMMVKIGDFNVSTYLRQYRRGFGCTGIVGTPGYTAPEVTRQDIYGAECDLWSLGVTVVGMFVSYGDHGVPNFQVQGWEDRIRDLVAELQDPDTRSFLLKALDVSIGLLDVDSENRYTYESVMDSDFLKLDRVEGKKKLVDLEGLRHQQPAQNLAAADVVGEGAEDEERDYGKRGHATTRKLRFHVMNDAVVCGFCGDGVDVPLRHCGVRTFRRDYTGLDRHILEHHLAELQRLAATQEDEEDTMDVFYDTHFAL